MVRRPLKGPWSGQAAPGYRAASVVTGLPLPSVDEALPELVRLHLRAYGPATRHDLTWWSGLTASRSGQVLAELGEDRTVAPGPYVVQRAPVRPPVRRLLPEFDAVFCAYQPAARGRFVTPEHHATLWSSANGLVLPPLLVDGRVACYWRSTGATKRRPLEVMSFRGTRKPRPSELGHRAARGRARHRGHRANVGALCLSGCLAVLP